MSTPPRTEPGTVPPDPGDRRWIDPDCTPVLLQWLSVATKSISITPEPGGLMGTRWAVEVGNDETDYDYECAVLCRANTEAEAELVAAALWALAGRRA